MEIDERDRAREARLEAIGHLLDAGRDDLAVEKAREVLRDDPDDPDVLTQMGWALRSLKRRDEAKEAGRAALAAEPRHPDGLLLLAAIAVDEGQHREAESFYLDALADNPEHPALLVAYGSLMLKVGRHEKAEQLARMALASLPDFPAAHRLLSLVLTETNAASGAADTHAQAGVRFAPASDLSHVARGVQLYRAGRPFAAKRHLREALRLDPRPDVEELFLAADLATRWCYLPMYYWSLLLMRLPGRQFLVWALFAAFFFASGPLGVNPLVTRAVVVGYLAMCVYTWVATPLAKLWVRWRPPR